MSEKIDKDRPDGSTLSMTPVRQPHCVRWNVECSWCGPIGVDLGSADSATLQKRHRHRSVKLCIEDFEYRSYRVRQVREALEKIIEYGHLSIDDHRDLLEGLGFVVEDLRDLHQGNLTRAFVAILDEYSEFFTFTDVDLDETVLHVLHAWLAKYELELSIDRRRLRA